VRTVTLSDFSGGLNLRDAPHQLALTETPDAINFTLDERGAIKWRKGCVNAVALPGVSGTLAYIYFSLALNLWLCCRETAGAPNTFRLYSRPANFSGAWVDRGQIASGVAAQATFADWSGVTPYALIATDVADATNGGVYTFDGTTLTKRAPTAMRAITVWQNRVWTASLGARLHRSDIGGVGVWTDFTDLREKDAAELTALGVVGGALIVFKKRSTYRINDSATGAYTTIDTSAGCLSALSLVAHRGRLYSWGVDALYEFDGIGPGRNVGDKARPLFVPTARFGPPGQLPIDPSGPPVLGLSGDSVIGAFSSDYGAVRDALLEFNPAQGWIMRHALASSSADAISSFATKDNTLYAAVNDGDVILKMFTETPGADNGVVPVTRFKTPWLQLNHGGLARLQRARIQGLVGTGTGTSLDFAVYRDWDHSSSDIYGIGDALRGGDSADDMETVDLNALGHSKAFQFEFVPGAAAGDVKIVGLILTAQELER
jgi:hypothetical protein